MWIGPIWLDDPPGRENQKSVLIFSSHLESRCTRELGGYCGRFLRQLIAEPMLVDPKTGELSGGCARAGRTYEPARVTEDTVWDRNCCCERLIAKSGQACGSGSRELK